MRMFFDSSGLAKRYIREPGSDKIDRLIAAATETAVSLIGPAEIVSALARLRRESRLTANACALIKRALFMDVEDMIVCNITVKVVERAIALLETHPVRTLDALAVAGAVEWEAELFVSADRRQLAVAEAAGLRIREV